MITIDYSNYLHNQHDWADSLTRQAARADVGHAEELSAVAGAAYRRVARMTPELRIADPEKC